jgi:fibronectin type 3 domain-containing protein
VCALTALATDWAPTLAWDPNPEPDVYKYTLYRADNNSSTWVKVADIMSTAPQEYTDIVNDSALPVHYYLTASNALLESDPSDVVGFNPVFPRKPSPLHIKAVHYAP